MAAKKKAKKEVEVIEAEIVEEVKTAPESIDLNNYVLLKDNYNQISDTVNAIRGLLNDTVNNYLKIGYLLSSITDDKLKELGCDSIYDFSKENFDLGVTSTKNFINVYKKFGVINNDVNYSPNYMMHFISLKEEFKDFSMSQLVELLPVPDEDFDKFTPDMTCKDIRALKKIGQLTDFESDFYSKVKKAFLEIWGKVYQSLNFETKNKIDDMKFILDGNGSYSFNIPCLGKNIILKIQSFIKSNDFSIYIESPRISYPIVYETFYCKFNEDYLACVDDIIKFINNDCYKYIEKNVSSKSSAVSPANVLSEMIRQRIDKYIGTMMDLTDFIHGDFFEFYKYARDNNLDNFIDIQDKLCNYRFIPNVLFNQVFELIEFDYYTFKLKKVLFENSPNGNNPNYTLELIISWYYGLYFNLYWDDSSHETFSLDDLDKYLKINTSNRDEPYLFNSVFSMFYYFAKMWAEEEYNNRSNDEESDDEDYDDEDNDDDESEAI